MLIVCVYLMKLPWYNKDRVTREENIKSLKITLKSETVKWGEEEKLLVTYTPYYYFFEWHCRDGHNNEELDFHQIAYPEIGYDKLVDVIVRDWDIYQIGKNEKYILGMTNCGSIPVVYSSVEERESFRMMVKEVLEKKIKERILKEKLGEYGLEWKIDIKYKKASGSYQVVSTTCRKHEATTPLLEYLLDDDTRKYRTKKYNMKFLFKVFSPKEFLNTLVKFYFAYNRYYFAQEENEYFDDPDIFLWDEKIDGDEFYTVGCAVEDWIHLQMTKQPDYVLGRDYQCKTKYHICTRKMYDDLENLVMDIMLKRFDKDFVETYDNTPRCYLVDIDFVWGSEKCQATKISIEDILNKKEPAFDGLGVPREKLLSCYTKDLAEFMAP